MTVEPAHGRLQHLVQLGHGEVAAQVEPPPDRRPGAVEVDPHAQHAHLVGGLGQLDLRCGDCGQALETAPARAQLAGERG